MSESTYAAIAMLLAYATLGVFFLAMCVADAYGSAIRRLIRRRRGRGKA